MVDLKIKSKDGYKICVVDEDDLERILKYKWYAWWSPKGKCFYVRASIGGKKIYIHRFIMNNSDKKVHTDHINHNTLDNRKLNLRNCSPSQNGFNRSGASVKNKTTQIRGICKTKQKTIIKNKVYEYEIYQAYFTINGKRVLKNFKTLEEANKFLNNKRPKLI